MKKDTPYLIDWIWIYFMRPEMAIWQFPYNCKINMVSENSISLLPYLYSVAHGDAFSVRVAEDDDARVADSRHP